MVCADLNTTPIAAFDFDGTLTTRDSLLLFIKYTHGFPLRLCRTLPTLFKTVIGLASRQEAKEALLTELYKGQTRSSLEILGKQFAEKSLDTILRPEMMERFFQHQKQGHRCVLVSANLDVYLVPWGKKYGFDAVLCSLLATDQAGILTGKLARPNCWGPEKVRQLREWMARENLSPSKLYAYGDSRGDAEMLAFAKDF